MAKAKYIDSSDPEKRIGFVEALFVTPRVLGLVWKGYPFGAILMPVLTVINAPVPAGYLYCMKRMIDGVEIWIGGDVAAGKTEVVTFFIAALVMTILKWGIEMFRQYLERIMEMRLGWSIQKSILDCAVELDMAHFETSGFYDKLQRAQDGTGRRPWAVISSLMWGLSQFSALAGYLVLLATLGWWVAPCMIMLVLPGFLIDAKFGLLGFCVENRRTHARRQMNYCRGLLTSDTAAKEIRMFGLGGFFMEKWSQGFWGFYREDRARYRWQHISRCAGILFETLGCFGLYGYAVYMAVNGGGVSGGGVTIGSLFMYMGAIEYGMGSVGTILQAIGGMYENNLYIRNLFEFLESKPKVTAPEVVSDVPRPMRGMIRFEDVTFRYPGSERDVLCGLNCEIRIGERVAIVGENGAGKTTMIKLLARLYDPQGGRITVDGIDVRGFEPSEWQEELGVIFQDYCRYSLTARENVGLGRLKWIDDIERVKAAGAMSGADGCVEKLKNGWETILGKTFEGGQELSGGEWQKIALARAFFRDAQLLILDEPTASLDAKQEYEVFSQFGELTRGKTAVLISHRFSSVRTADRIMVIENGGIVEVGSHKELLELGGRYAELFERQASSYV